MAQTSALKFDDLPLEDLVKLAKRNRLSGDNKYYVQHEEMETLVEAGGRGRFSETMSEISYQGLNFIHVCTVSNPACFLVNPPPSQHPTTKES